MIIRKSKSLHLTVLLFIVNVAAFATHYMGGDVSYEYLDNNGPAGNPYRYKIKFDIYISGNDPNSAFYCGPGGNGANNGNIDFAIYNANSGTRIEDFDAANSVQRYNCTLSNTIIDVSPPMPPGCSVTGISDLCIKLNRYETIVNLPFSFDGFLVVHDRCCRNGGGTNAIDNLLNPGSYGTVFYTTIPATTYINSSPQFTDLAIPAVCTGDTTSVVNNAYDPDGDFLVYSFAEAVESISSSGNPAPDLCSFVGTYNLSNTTIPYVSGYDATNPFGPGGYAYINSSTGYTEYYIPNAGDYVVAIKIDEYRNVGGNSVLLNSTIREVQIISRACPPNDEPIITLSQTTNTTINIYEGDSLHLDISSTDPDLDNVNITVSGAIIDTASSFPGPYATFVEDTAGTGAYDADFDWQTVCNMEGSYQFAISATDDGCPPKTLSKVYTINVLPFEASNISGPDSVCFLDDSSVFSTSGSSTSSYEWVVTNGSISGYNSDSTEISVSWGIPGNGRIDMIETSEKGCKDSTFKVVVVKDAEFLTAAGDTTICEGDTVMVSATGAGLFLWTPENMVLDSSQATTFAFPDSTTDFIIQSRSNLCYLPDTVTIEVNHFESNVPDDTTCMRDSLTIGSPAIAGYTYSWTNTEGLNDTSLAQPTLYLDTAGVFTYTVSVVDSNQCKGSDTLNVLLNPTPDSVGIFGGNSICPAVTNIQYYVSDTTLIGYNWSVDGDSSFTGQGSDTIYVDWGLANSNASVNIVPTNIYGCVGDTSKYQVIINPILQTETPNGPDTLCFFDIDSNNYSITQINGSTYTWNVIGGIQNSGDSSNAVNISWNGDSIAYVFIQEQVTTVAGNCFGQSDTLFVKILPSPDTSLNIAGNLDLCSFDSLNDYALQGLDSSFYVWVVDTGGVIINGQGTNTITVNWDSAGIYPISVLETTKDGCVGGILDTSVIIRPLPATSVPEEANPNFKICRDLDSVYYTVNGFENSTYQWGITGGDSIETNTSEVYVNWDTSWTKELFAFETTEYGCVKDTVVFNITYDPSDITLISVSDGFEDETQVELNWSRYAIDDTLTRDLEIYRRQISPTVSAWEFVDSVSKFETSYVDQSLATSSTIYEYHLWTSNICADSITTLPHNNILLAGSGDEESAVSTLNWNHYSDWVKFEGIREYNIYRNLDDEGYELYETTSSLDSVIEFTNGGDGFTHCYRVEAIQEYNDEVTSWSNEICIDYVHDLVVYNALTPNGDNKNETFFIKNIWLYPENEVQIYNRWGNLVYNKSGYNNEWDGGNLPDGTYYYIVKVNHKGEQLLFKKDLLLQR